MADFTPGPWKVVPEIDGWMADKKVVIKMNDKRVAECWNSRGRKYHHEGAEANAHLIAAAPDMYEALDHIQYLHASGAFKLKDEDYIAICKVADALAKAEGGED